LPSARKVRRGQSRGAPAPAGAGRGIRRPGAPRVGSAGGGDGEREQREREQQRLHLAGSPSSDSTRADRRLGAQPRQRVGAEAGMRSSQASVTVGPPTTRRRRRAAQAHLASVASGRNTTSAFAASGAARAPRVR
jgi:hypothetical protein